MVCNSCDLVTSPLPIWPLKQVMFILHVTVQYRVATSRESSVVSSKHYHNVNIIAFERNLLNATLGLRS